jgi:hypothetical protein
MTDPNASRCGGAGATPEVQPNGQRACDMCGCDGPLERVDRDWLCPVHAADRKGYTEGRRFMALMSVGNAVRLAIDESCTRAMVREAVELALMGDYRLPDEYRLPAEPPTESFFHPDTVHEIIAGHEEALPRLRYVERGES